MADRVMPIIANGGEVVNGVARVGKATVCEGGGNINFGNDLPRLCAYNFSCWMTDWQLHHSAA